MAAYASTFKNIKPAPCSLVELKRLLHYNPDTGVFTRLTGPNAGKTAGQTSNGQIWLNKKAKAYGYAHRLAWYYMTGRWPIGLIDHINRNNRDNRWSNLREATPYQNLCNACNQGSLAGISLESGKYYLTIRLPDKYGFKTRPRFGPFKTLVEAASYRRKLVKDKRGVYCPVDIDVGYTAASNMR